MNQSPFQQKSLKDEDRPGDPVFVKFSVENGNLVTTDDDDKAYAKSSDRRWYVKFASSTGEMYNPWETMNVAGELNICKGGVSKYNWLSVNKNTYDLYVKFLQTKNKVYLESARGAF